MISAWESRRLHRTMEFDESNLQLKIIEERIMSSVSVGNGNYRRHVGFCGRLTPRARRILKRRGYKIEEVGTICGVLKIYKIKW